MPNWLLSAGAALDDDERRHEEYRKWKTARPLRRETIEGFMTTLDDIARERQRIADRLALLDAERVKLAEELAELETAQRVLSRLGHLRSAGRTREPAIEPPAPTEPSRKPRQRQTKAPAVVKSPTMSLGDATLRAVSALGNGVSAEQVRNYLEQELGMQVRANHLGRALHRHRLAGRLEERDSRWWAPEPTAPVDMPDS